MTIDMPCRKCTACGRLQYDNRLSIARYRLFKNILNKSLKLKYDFNMHNGLWMDLNEFSLMLGYDNGFVLGNIRFFSTGIFSKKVKGTWWFLRKSVDLYKKEDNGLFWLTDSNDMTDHVGCHWCGVGDLHEVDSHVLYDSSIGKYRIHYPANTCSYCGSFSADPDEIDRVKQKEIKRLTRRQK